MTTKWEKEIPIRYKELFENYKNIEMFQNIHSSKEIEPIIEGFNFAGDDFDMDAKRDSIFTTSTLGKDLMDGFNQLKEYILCPFNKSDQIIDNGIQKLLKIFLAVECNDISLEKISKDLKKKDEDIKKDDSQILDLTDLIDPNLLYQTEESFTDKKKTKVDCTNKENAEKDIKSYSSMIRREIYNILFLPLIIHMFYNCYYMFFYKDKPEFIDIEKKFYEPYLKNYLNYFLGIVIKPLTWLRYILFFIANPADEEHGYTSLQFLVNWMRDYPYIFFIGLYVFMFSILSVYGKNILSLWGDLLLGTTANPFVWFVGGVMLWEFGKAFIGDLPSWANELSRPISGSIKFIIYWIIRLVINLMIFPFGAYLCLLYVFVYLFFGVFISSNKDSFDVFGDINDSIYEKVYKLFDYRCDGDSYLNKPIQMVQFVIKYSIFFLIELTLLLILSNGCTSYGNQVKNPNVLAFLLVLNFTTMFIIGIWSFTKYLTEMPKLDAKYDPRFFTKKGGEEKENVEEKEVVQPVVQEEKKEVVQPVVQEEKKEVVPPLQ